jgi:Zn finger protein HypA/HybF involved in hydrogenase expression
MKHHKWSEENIKNLIDVVKTSKSIAQVVNKMQFNHGGGARRRIKKAIAKFNISTTHFTGQLWSKGKTALDDDRVGKSPDNIFIENSGCSRGYIKKLIIKSKLKEYKCDICNLTSWLDKSLILHLDHINGKNNDHRLENLRFLCPNCHSQTSTYCKNSQNRYTDSEILEASVNCSTIHEVMVKLAATSGANYKRFKKILPHLVNAAFTPKIPKPPKNPNWRTDPKPHSRKVVRPSKEELEKLIETTSMETLGKNFGVSGNAVKKWCKSYGIKTKPPGYWAKMNFSANILDSIK